MVYYLKIISFITSLFISPVHFNWMDNEGGGGGEGWWQDKTNMDIECDRWRSYRFAGVHLPPGFLSFRILSFVGLSQLGFLSNCCNNYIPVISVSLHNFKDFAYQSKQTIMDISCAWYFIPLHLLNPIL